MEYKGFQIVKERHYAGGLTFERTVYNEEGDPLDCFMSVEAAKKFIDEIV